MLEHAVKTKYGIIHVFDDSIGRAFIDGGYYEQGKIDLVLKECERLKRNRVAIDVGANYGTHALAYTSVFNYVIAFEPQPELFALLQKTLPKAELYNMALGNHNGMVNFGEPFKTQGDRKNFGAAGVTSVGQAVKIRPLDSFGFQDVDLIKIDVEGYERFVFAGARETIKKNRPIILFENIGLGDKYPKFNFNILDFLIDECKYQRIKAVNKACTDLIAIP